MTLFGWQLMPVLSVPWIIVHDRSLERNHVRLARIPESERCDAIDPRPDCLNILVTTVNDHDGTDKK